MTRWVNIGTIIIIIILHSCKGLKNKGEWVLPSPDSKIHLYFNLNDGEPYYLAYYEDKIIVDWSLIGVTLQNQVNLAQGLSVCYTESDSKTSNNEIFLKGGFEPGDQYNELKVCLEKSTPSHQLLIIEFRAYNEGIAFRYFLPDENPDPTGMIIHEETQFDLYDKGTVWTFANGTSNKIAVPRVDELKYGPLTLPACFASDNGIEVTLTESNTPGHPETMLIKRGSGGQSFSIIQSKPFNDVSAIEKYRPEIPWRVIIINKIDEQSSNRN